MNDSLINSSARDIHKDTENDYEIDSEDAAKVFDLLPCI
jgi:hypothetical protein